MTQPVIVTEGLTKTYGTRHAVIDLNLGIHQGETFSLLGPNGAGKSTTINLMLGLKRPTAGTVRIMGHAPQASAARAVTGYVAQDVDFPPFLTALEILRLVSSHYPDPAPIDELVAVFGLEALSGRQAGGFSGGERRRLALALAFAGRGRVVFLDEPTTGLDGEARRAFWTFAKAFVGDGGTLLLTTHQLEEIESVADRICLIDRGTVRLDGSIGTIRDRVAQKRVCFDCSDPPVLVPVSRSEFTDGRMSLLTPDADGVVRQLIASGVAFSDLEVRSATLEEAITHLAPQQDGESP